MLIDIILYGGESGNIWKVFACIYALTQQPHPSDSIPKVNFQNTE